MRRTYPYLCGLSAALWSMASQASSEASAVVENIHAIAGAEVGTSAPAFWSQPGDDWSWFLMPAAGIVALWFIWRALTRKK